MQTSPRAPEHPAPGAAAPARRPGGWRGLEVILLYVTFALGGFAINGIGSILLPLQPELGVDRSVVALYPALFAAGPLTVGLLGARLVRVLGQRGTLAAAYALTLVGAAMLGLPALVPSAAGAFVLGFAGALVNVVLPVRLAELHPTRGASLLSEANGIASVVSILAPTMIGAALGAGLGWRAGYLLPIVVVAVALFAAWFARLGVTDTVDDVSLAESAASPGGRIPGLLERWLDLPLAVSAEFAILYWSATAIAEWHGAETAVATASASAFLAGMAVTRLLGAQILDVRPARQAVLGSAAVAIVGFAGFWAGPSLWVSVAGLFVAGVGIALLYPASVTRLLRIAGRERQRASQYAILASGLSVGLAPLLLAAIAGLVGMRWAYLMVPLLLVTLLLKNLRASAE